MGGDYKDSTLNQVYYDSMAMIQRAYETDYKDLKTLFDGYIPNPRGIAFTDLDSIYTDSVFINDNIRKHYKRDTINIKYWATSKASNNKASVQVTGTVDDNNNTILENIVIYWPNAKKEISLHPGDIDNIPSFEKREESPPIIEGEFRDIKK